MCYHAPSTQSSAGSCHQASEGPYFTSIIPSYSEISPDFMNPTALEALYKPKSASCNCEGSQTSRYDQMTPDINYTTHDSDKRYDLGPDMSPKEILDIYHDIFGTDNSGDGIYFVEKNKVKNIDGKEVHFKGKDISNFLEAVYDTAKGSRAFCATYNDPTGQEKDLKFVYAPEGNDKTYWLTLSEELFHAIDGLKSYDPPAKEAAAVLGRYLVTRYLGEKNEINLTDEYKTLLALGIPVIDTTQDMTAYELKFLYPGHNYKDRLWLRDYLDDLNGVGFKEAITSLRNTYGEIIESPNPREAIKYIGKAHGTDENRIQSMLANSSINQYQSMLTMINSPTACTIDTSYPISDMTGLVESSYWSTGINIQVPPVQPLGGIIHNPIYPKKYYEEQIKLHEQSTHTF